LEDFAKAVGTAFIVVFVALAVIFGLGLLLAFPVMWCWNYVIPQVTHEFVSSITYSQAYALLVLSGLLFKSSNTNTSTKK